SLNSSADPQRGYEIFQRATDAFEDGYIASGDSAVFLSPGNLVQIGDDMRTVDRPVVDRDKQVACFRERAVIGIHDNTGAAHGFIVDLACMRLKSSYQVQVRARLKPSPVKEGFDRGGAGADHFRIADANFRRYGLYFDAVLRPDLPAEALEIRSLGAADQKASELAHARNDRKMGGGLASTAKNAERLHIAAREHVRGDGRCGRGAQLSKIVGFKARDRNAGGRVEELVDRLDAGFRAHAHQLDPGGLQRGVITRHHQQHRDVQLQR